MRKYAKEAIALLAQLIVFYAFPMLSVRLGAILMVLMIILETFIISVFLGILSKNRIKFVWPVAVAALFLPSVFLFYNASAIVHAAWYFFVSTIGLVIGAGINRLR